MIQIKNLREMLDMAENLRRGLRISLEQAVTGDRNVGFDDVDITINSHDQIIVMVRYFEEEEIEGETYEVEKWSYDKVICLVDGKFKVTNAGGQQFTNEDWETILLGKLEHYLKYFKKYMKDYGKEQG